MEKIPKPEDSERLPIHPKERESDDPVGDGHSDAEYAAKAPPPLNLEQHAETASGRPAEPPLDAELATDDPDTDPPLEPTSIEKSGLAPDASSDA